MPFYLWKLKTYNDDSVNILCLQNLLQAVSSACVPSCLLQHNIAVVERESGVNLGGRGSLFETANSFYHFGKGTLLGQLWLGCCREVERRENRERPWGFLVNRIVPRDAIGYESLSLGRVFHCIDQERHQVQVEDGITIPETLAAWIWDAFEVHIWQVYLSYVNAHL